MRLAAFIVLGLLAGCVAGGSLRPTNAAPVAAPRGASAAAEVARAEWSRRLGVALPAPPAVLWFAGDRLTYEVHRGAVISSIYWPGNGELHVAVMGGKPSDGGFVHEMLHWALWRSQRLADQKHEHPAWAQVNEVRAVLREAGL